MKGRPRPGPDRTRYRPIQQIDLTDESMDTIIQQIGFSDEFVNKNNPTTIDLTDKSMDIDKITQHIDNLTICNGFINSIKDFLNF